MSADKRRYIAVESEVISALRRAGVLGRTEVFRLTSKIVIRPRPMNRSQKTALRKTLARIADLYTNVVVGRTQSASEEKSQ